VTGAAGSTGATYGPHESNLRALSERLGRIDELKSRQEDGESLNTDELLEVKMEEQVQSDLRKEIKSSPGLEPRVHEDDMDQDLPPLDTPAGSLSGPPEQSAGGTEAAVSDVKMEGLEAGETADTTTASRAEKPAVYIKLEDDD
jgi:hypothetical protein